MKKYIKNTRLFIISLNIIASLSCIGQTGDALLKQPNSIPPSPNAANLGAFGNVENNLYNGIPKVSIPVIEISVGDFKLPITLNYKGGGVKVDDISSWTGLGWTLNAGGCITRTQRGLADELPNYGYQSTPTTLAYLSRDEQYNYLTGLRDCQPDDFYYSFGNNNGSFVITKDHEFKVANLEEVLVSNEVSSTGIYFMGIAGAECDKRPLLYISWKIIDSEGNTFIFDKYEKTLSFGRYYSMSNGEILTNYNTTSPDPISLNPAINTWYLSKIITKDKDIINLDYEDEEYCFDISGDSRLFCLKDPDQIPSWWPGSVGNFQQNLTSQRLYCKTKRLSSITTPEYLIEFKADVNRADLVGSKQLDKIQIKKIDGTLLKEYLFRYKYLFGNQLIPTDQAEITNNVFDEYFNFPDAYYYRLMLTDLVECTPDNQQKFYKFDYFHDIGLPNRMSIWKDHWGYSNGPEKDPNLRFLPYLYYNAPIANGLSIMPERQPELDHCKQGTLNKILYPTGGNTQFDFGINKCFTNFLPNPLEWIPDKKLEINYLTFPNLTSYNSEIRTIDKGTHINDELICHYIDFTINDLIGGAYIDLELNNYPTDLGSVGAIGFFIVKTSVSPELEVWDLHSDLLNFNYSSYNCSYPNPNIGIHEGIRKFQMFFDNGTYRLYHYPINNNYMNPVLPNCPDFYKYSLTVKGHYQQYAQDVKDVGGLRIEKTTDYTEDGEEALIKKYTYEDENGIPSGKIVNFPSYIEDLDLILYTFTGPALFPPSAVPEIPLSYKILKSNSNYPLLTTGGSYIGYSVVQEQIINSDEIAQNGKIIYKFSTSENFPDLNFNGTPADQNLNPFPYPPLQSHDYKRGKLLQEIIKDDQGNIKQTTTNSYDNLTYLVPSQVIDFNIYPTGYEEGWSYLLGEGFISCSHGHLITSEHDWYVNFPTNPFTIANYSHVYGSSHLAQTIIEDYTPNGIITQTTNFSYKNSRQNRIEKSTSVENEKIVTEIKYPDDFPNDEICSKLSEWNQLNEIIEKQTFVDRNNSISNIQHIKVNYDYTDGSNNFIKKKSIEVKNGNSNSFETEFTYTKYTVNHARINEYTNHAGLFNSFLWEATEQKPISQIINASNNEFGYCGFENNDLNGWSFASDCSQFSSNPSNVFTGKTSLSCGVKNNFKVGLQASKHSGYKFCIWIKNLSANSTKLKLSVTSNPSVYAETAISQSTGSWQYCEVELPYQKYSSLTIDDNFTIRAEVIDGGSDTYLDDARFYPMDAEMTTYTYEPLIGMTSVSDANNKPTYYEYDAFGRLSVIKDYLGNILKKYDYHYRPQ